MEQMETITGKHNESKYRVVDYSHSGYIYKTSKAQETLWKRRWNSFKSQRTREFTLKLCLLVRYEGISIKFQQHNCPNKSWTGTIPVSRSKYFHVPFLVDGGEKLMSLFRVVIRNMGQILFIPHPQPLTEYKFLEWHPVL